MRKLTYLYLPESLLAPTYETYEFDRYGPAGTIRTLNLVNISTYICNIYCAFVKSCYSIPLYIFLCKNISRLLFYLSFKLDGLVP